MSEILASWSFRCRVGLSGSGSLVVVGHHGAIESLSGSTLTGSSSLERRLPDLAAQASDIHDGRSAYRCASCCALA